MRNDTVQWNLTRAYFSVCNLGMKQSPSSEPQTWVIRPYLVLLIKVDSSVLKVGNFMIFQELVVVDSRVYHGIAGNTGVAVLTETNRIFAVNSVMEAVPWRISDIPSIWFFQNFFMVFLMCYEKFHFDGRLWQMYWHLSIFSIRASDTHLVFVILVSGYLSLSPCWFWPALLFCCWESCCTSFVTG